MAFGDLKGTLTGSADDITASNSITGSVSVAVGDLVFVTFGQLIALTATTVSDNLGNTYTATNAGTDAGASTGRSYYSYVTVAGTLTTVDVVATASTNDWAGVAAVIEGPFKSSPLDKNPANGTADTASPFTCPATGTLTQADEVVMSWVTFNGGGTWLATSPNLKADQAVSPAGNIKVIVGYQAVSATTTVSPAFTGTAPASDVLGTSTFMKGASNKTIAADTGAHTFAGTTVAIRQARKAVAGVGAHSFSGTNVGLKHGLRVAVGVGAHSFSNTSVTLRRAWKVVAGSRAHSFAGTSVSLKQGHRIAVGLGAHTFAGTDISLTLSATKKIIAGAGAHSFSNADISLWHAWRLTAGAGAHSFSGTSITLKHGWKVGVGIGAHTFSGDDVTLTIASPPPVPIIIRHGGGPWKDHQTRQQESREELQRTIEQAWRIANGEIDPITLEVIPPPPLPDYSLIEDALAEQAVAEDQQRIGAFIAAQQRGMEDEAVAILLLA